MQFFDILKPDECNLQTAINLSDSGNAMLVQFCHYRVIVGQKSHAKYIHCVKKYLN